MKFQDKEHMERFENALKTSGAVQNDGTINPDFGASLFVLAGMPGVCVRVQPYIHEGWLDFESMLSLPLSSGERILVSLAGNLYNGGFFDGYGPAGIIAHCSSDMVRLAVTAIWMRSQQFNVSMIGWGT